MWGMLKLSRIHVMNFTGFIYHTRRMELLRREGSYFMHRHETVETQNLFNILPSPMANGQINLSSEMLCKFIEIPVQLNVSPY